MQSRVVSWVFALSACTWLLAGCASTRPSASTHSIESSRYLVKRGDSLASIARSNALPLVFLQQHNSIVNADRLAVGQLLDLPKRPPRYIWPLGHLDISSGFRQPRPNHQGIDLRASQAAPIHAIAAGVVRFAGTQSGFGKVVIIEHESGLTSLYGHNSLNLVRAEQKVQQGEVIARVGRSGNATGFHLHLELQECGVSRDPYDFLPN